MSNDTSTSWSTWLGFVVLVAVTSAFSWYFFVDTQAAQVQDPNSTVPPMVAFTKADDNAKIAAPEDVAVAAEKGVKNITEGTEIVSRMQAPGGAEDSSGADAKADSIDADQGESAASESASEQQFAAAEPAQAEEPGAAMENSSAVAAESVAPPAEEKPAAPVRVVTAKDVNIETQETTSGVKYVSGGIGQDEILYMLSAFNNYSFKLTNFRDQGKRAYLSRVKVQISDGQGKQVLADTTKGPFLFADLPAGDYQVEANYMGQSQSKKVSISAGAQNSIQFNWKTAKSD